MHWIASSEKDSDILYLPAEVRFDYLLNRPEAGNIGAKSRAIAGATPTAAPSHSCVNTRARW
jgi:hypothetical protein